MSASRARPLIGVCAALEQARWGAWDTPSDLLPRMYVEAVQAAGAAALLIPVDPGWVDGPERALDPLDGLLVAGGVDVDPASYGESPHAETKGASSLRDACELALLGCALERGMPLLGICRGMQLINVWAGGTLIQHLPEHSSQAHLVTPGSFAGSEHSVRLEQGSLIAEILGADRISVNSHHHQAIDRLGDGLCVSARCETDGVIEAVEPTASAFALGVQWHPEADDADRVIGAFVAAATPHLSAPG